MAHAALFDVPRCCLKFANSNEPHNLLVSILFMPLTFSWMYLLHQHNSSFWSALAIFKADVSELYAIYPKIVRIGDDGYNLFTRSIKNYIDWPSL
jgi:hypothetical protein